MTLLGFFVLLMVSSFVANLAFSFFIMLAVLSVLSLALRLRPLMLPAIAVW